MRDLFFNNRNGIERGVIKTIQSGTINLAGITSTAPGVLTAVDVNNTLLIFNGVSSLYSGNQYYDWFCQITLTSSTQITASRYGSDPSSCLVSYTALEFYPGIFRSIQYGTTTTGTGATGTGTLSTAVNVNKSFVLNLGGQYNTTNANDGRTVFYTSLTNSTTVTAISSTALGNNWNASFVVAEYN
jgi:hypothetical protein